jgi:hypothetical protein
MIFDIFQNDQGFLDKEEFLEILEESSKLYLIILLKK